MHPRGREDPGDLGQLARGPDPDRTVAFGGNPVEAAQPLSGLTQTGGDIGVHAVRHLDQRPVRRHLAAVKAQTG
jgi:hypothetical protein